MTGTLWTLNAVSSVPSPTWDDYAHRLAALLQAVGDGLGGEVAWYSDRVARGGSAAVSPSDAGRLQELIVEHQLRNDRGEVMPGAGSRPPLFGERTVPQGMSRLVMRPRLGADDAPFTAHVEATEPPGYSIWSYPDQTVAGLVGKAMTAIGAAQAEILDDDVLGLFLEADLPVVGTHSYVPGPLDASRFPPGARQGPCGKGYLLIVPPGPTPEDTLERMRWVAAATGQA